MPQVKICRDCGEEYRLEAVRCADCGGELLTRELDESGGVAPPEGPGEQEGEEIEGELSEPRVVFETVHAADLVPLAEGLREAQIDYRLLEKRPNSDGAPVSFALVVQEKDADHALDALRRLLAPQGEAGELHALDSRYQEGRGYVHCPACGAEQDPAAGECGECGLVLGAPEDRVAVCSRCGAPLPEPGATCSACGRALG